MGKFYKVFLLCLFSCISGNAYNRVGLWFHCYRMLPHSNNVYERRFIAGCRWIYSPFVGGYDQIRGFLVPTFLIMTQFFYSLAFIIVTLCAVVVVISFLSYSRDDERYEVVNRGLGASLILASISAAIACVIFGVFASEQWLPGFENKSFGWTFYLACISVLVLLITGVTFLADNYLERRHQEREYEKNSHPSKS